MVIITGMFSLAEVGQDGIAEARAGRAACLAGCKIRIERWESKERRVDSLCRLHRQDVISLPHEQLDSVYPMQMTAASLPPPSHVLTCADEIGFIRVTGGYLGIVNCIKK